MKYLVWTVVSAGLAWGEQFSHDRFDAPAVGTMVAIGSGLVGLAFVRAKRRQD